MAEHEPDNYSIDEMMQRLRARGGHQAEGEPELVTRPDGSQAIKVRKRKRRTHQPHKEAEKRRRRRMLIGTTLVTVSLVALALGFLGWFLYLNSGAYRQQVTSKIEAWTGAGLEMRGFRATPVNAGAEFLELSWPENLPAARLKLNHLRGDLRVTSHLTGQWEGEQMGAGSGELVLRHASEPSRIDLPEGPLPFRMPLRVQQLNVRFGEGERVPFAIYQSSASISVADPENPEANLILQNGSCRIGSWGRFHLDFASLLLAADGLHLGNLRLLPEDGENSEFVISGEGFPAIPAGGGREAEFRLGVRAMPSLVLFGAGLGTLIEGTFETLPEDETGRVFLDPVRLESLRIDAAVRSAAGSILKFYRFPMFENLGDLFDSPRFVQGRFDPESSLRIVRGDESVRLEDLDLVAEGMMRLRGTIEESKGGRLSGTLQVGIADSFFAIASSPAAARMFRREIEGYRWAEVNLGGTTKAPSDDLESQLTAAQEAISPAVGGERGLEDAFLELTTPDE